MLVSTSKDQTQVVHIIRHTSKNLTLMLSLLTILRRNRTDLMKVTFLTLNKTKSNRGILLRNHAIHNTTLLHNRHNRRGHIVHFNNMHRVNSLNIRKLSILLRFLNQINT